MYSFGCNDHGALGRKTIDDSEWFAPQPIKAFAADHVIRISAGDGHSAAVTEDGRLFVWGTFRVCHNFYSLFVIYQYQFNNCSSHWLWYLQFGFI